MHGSVHPGRGREAGLQTQRLEILGGIGGGVGGLLIRLPQGRALAIARLLCVIFIVFGRLGPAQRPAADAAGGQRTWAVLTLNIGPLPE